MRIGGLNHEKNNFPHNNNISYRFIDIFTLFYWSLFITCINDYFYLYDFSSQLGYDVENRPVIIGVAGFSVLEHTLQLLPVQGSDLIL